MALDAAMLYYTANELKKTLVGTRLDKLYMPARDEVVILLRSERETFKLLISARSGSARIHLTKEDFENPSTPPAFCMLLRKRLMSGRVTDIRTEGGERICFVEFEATNELGDRVRVTLSAELMGRYSNIVVIDENNRVIDALKRIDFDQSEKRQLLPGLPFTMPPKQEGRVPFLLCGEQELSAEVVKKSMPLSDALQKTLAGAGPAVCREMAWRVSPADADADTLSADERQGLTAELARVKRAADGDKASLNIVYDGERPVEFSFIELDQYENARRVSFESASELFDSYYSEKDREERAKARSHDLKKQVTSLLERAVRRRDSRAVELANTEKAEEKRLFGELLTANLYAVARGEKSFAALNYYTGESVTIPLDARLSANGNAQKYYKEYRKLMTAKTMLARLIAEGENEIKYLTSVLYEIGEAKTEGEFINIRKELKEAGFLRSYKLPTRKSPKTADVLEYCTSDGFRVLVGRNNAANDKLTLKTAEKNDFWFHVKNAAGSHTVLCAEGREVSDAALTEAAALAALHSSESTGEQVAVDYTRVRYVKKPAGARAGMVIYTDYKTAFVTPEKELEERLRTK